MTATSTGNGLCLPVSETVKLTFIPTPTVDAGPNRIYCDEIPLVDLAGKLTGTTDIEWASNGDGNFTDPVNSRVNNFQTTATDTLGYVLMTLSANINGVGCYNYDQFIIGFEPAPSINISSTAACEGDTILLIGQPTNITEDSTAIYQWTFGANILQTSDSILEVLETGTYTLDYILDRCQVNLSATIVFNPDALPIASYTKTLCPNDGETTIDLTIKGAYDKYYWVELNDSSQTVTVNTSGTYNFIVFNEFNCTENGTATIQLLPAPLIDVEDLSSCEGDTIFLVGKPSNINNELSASYEWSYNGTLFNVTDSIVLNSKEGYYTVNTLPQNVKEQ